MVIALVLSLVMFKTLLFTEGQRRTTGGGNDAQQSGTLGGYILERYVRMGGAGFDQIDQARGCILNASYNNVVKVPLPAAIPAPFNGLANANLAVAPVLIANAGTTANGTAADPTPDTLIVMAGTHPSINTFLELTAPTTSAAATVKNTFGFMQYDVLLGVETTPGAGNYGKCKISQTSSSVDGVSTSPTYRQSTDNSGKTLTLGGTSTPYNASGLLIGSTAYTSGSLIADLGKEPIFWMFGITPKSELASYDILQGPAAPSTVADGVVNLQAVYGLSATTASDDTQVTTWQPPTGQFLFSTLTNGSAASADNLKRIRAVRVGLITRSSVQEKAAIDGVSATWTLFGDLPAAAQVTDTRTGTALNYRYRQFDVLIALRNH